jgi:glycosyltransferase involved in cell wall biosynthesis
VDYEDDVCGFIHEWAEGLARRVSVLDVLTLRKRKANLPANVRLHVLKPRGDEGKLTATVRFYHALLKIVRSSSVNSIFSHMTPIHSVIASPIAKLWHIPLVTWYTHETVSFPLRLAEKLSDKILTASRESFRLDSEKVVVTNHGINTQIFCPQHISGHPEQSRISDHPEQSRGAHHSSPITICSIGRISPRKDYETLIKAANILIHSKEIHNVRFVIIGKEGTSKQKPYFQKLTEMVKTFGLESFVEFAGSVPHRKIAAYHQKSDIFVNMRQTGGMDKAVLEAMACEIPPVVCNKTFAPLFGLWAGQLIFEERNAEDLADRLSDLVTSGAERRQEIGRDLRNVVVREHDLERLMDRIVTVFESL